MELQAGTQSTASEAGKRAQCSPTGLPRLRGRCHETHVFGRGEEEAKTMWPKDCTVSIWRFEDVVCQGRYGGDPRVDRLLLK